MRYCKSILVAVAGLMPLMANPAFASETNSGDDEARCLKKVGIAGRPHKLNTVASLSAVRAWSQRAMKHGENYAMWHNAEGATIKCEKLPRSDYYKCFASAKPCKGSLVDKTAANSQ